MIRPNICAACFVFLSGAVAAGQNSPDNPATLESLQREVQQLQEQVSGLQAQLAVQPVPTPPASSQAATVALTDSSATRGRSHITFRGFGEVDYQALDQRQPEIAGGGFVPGSAANFYSGNFDLLLTAPISSRLNVLSEINFQESDAQHFAVDVERLLLNFDYKDWLRISIGRYQTAIGYYNTVFMSGAWPQTTADRPLIMAFPDDGGVMPVQAIGVSLKGAIPSGKFVLNYLFEYGSSDTMRTRFDGLGSIDDENNGNQVNVGIFLRPDWVPGLEAGGSFYHDDISDDRNLSIRYRQSILNAHIVYVARGLEFLNEGVLIRHAQTDGANVFNMPGAYTQISKQLGHVRPFCRFQYLNTNPRSSLHDVGLRYGPSFGARYDFNSNVAFKLQFDHTHRRLQPDLNGIQTEISFAF
jgi:hypothetical protein